MKHRDKSSSSITTLTIVVPFITLLLYGILSHMFFFFSQNEERREELITYKKTLIDTQKNSLKERVESFVQLIKYYEKKENPQSREDICTYIQSHTQFKNGSLLLSKSDKEGFYQDEKSIFYTQYLPLYDCYLTAYKETTEIKLNIQQRQLYNEKRERTNAKTNLNILLFTWLISLILSLYLSMIINRMLKSYEQRLQATNEKLIFQSRQALIGELFSMIAHQWRQPINKVASILALLRFKLVNKSISYERIDKKCHEVEESIEFISETIDDFRTFYQPKKRREKIDLKRVIEKSISFIDAPIKKKEIEIIKELESIKVDIYANEFLQVMINLIHNAVDAIGHQGQIIIKLYKEQNSVIVVVEDNGVGIEKEVISKVFDPYYTTKKESMGLGLYMSKIIIEKHMSGEIEIERLPRGSRFIIEFKLDDSLY